MAVGWGCRNGRVLGSVVVEFGIVQGHRLLGFHGSEVGR